jgi:hypothetical protein
MPDSCIKRRLLFACRQSYARTAPPAGGPVGWLAPPQVIEGPSPHGPGNIDCALVGRVPEGILLVFRGTLPPFTKDKHPPAEVALDWLNNVELVSRDNGNYPGRVHRGFARSVDSLWERIAAAIDGLATPGGGDRLFITGHSKGGALANLAAWRALALDGLARPVRVYTVAAARAGNEEFRAACADDGGIVCTRYESAFDAVPLVPFGADTPAWVKALARKVWPRLLDNNFVPVGTRFPHKTTMLERWSAARRYAGWLGLGGARSNYMPLLTQAHDISPGSAYDGMVCDGEPGCTHE